MYQIDNLGESNTPLFESLPPMSLTCHASVKVLSEKLREGEYIPDEFKGTWRLFDGEIRQFAQGQMRVNNLPFM